MFDLNTSALRFWEKEFSELKPKKNSRGIRKYTPKNIEIISNSGVSNIKIRLITII